MTGVALGIMNSWVTITHWKLGPIEVNFLGHAEVSYQQDYSDSTDSDCQETRLTKKVIAVLALIILVIAAFVVSRAISHFALYNRQSPSIESQESASIEFLFGFPGEKSPGEVNWNPQGTFFFVSASSGSGMATQTFHVVPADSKEVVFSYTGRMASWSKDGNLLVLLEDKKTFRLFSAPFDPDKYSDTRVSLDFSQDASLNSRQGWAYSPNSETWATISISEKKSGYATLRLKPLNAAPTTHRFKTKNSQYVIFEIGFSNDGRYLAISNLRGVHHLWIYDTQEQQMHYVGTALIDHWLFPSHTQSMFSCWGKNKKVFFGEGMGHPIESYDLITKERTIVYQPDEDTRTDKVRVSSDGNFIAFIEVVKGNYLLRIISADGTTEYKGDWDDLHIFRYCWHPERNTLILADFANRKTGKKDIHVYSIDLDD